MGNMVVGKERIPEVAFPESLRNAILAGTKLVTIRPQPLGEVGSVFIAFGHEFVVVDVTEVPLALVTAVLFKAEGFETGEAFIDYWRRAYPEARYTPDRIVYCHIFRKTGR